MAVFKQSKGLEANLPSTKVDGHFYFCIDTGNIYIDYTNASNELVRSKISAKYADKLRYTDNNSNTIEINASDIATKNYVDNHNSSSVTIKTWTESDI